MSEKHRYVALKLSGLRRADRQWLLGNFAESDQARIREYLSELNAFRLDKETLKTVLDSREPKTTSAKAKLTTPPELINSLLAAEPAWITRAISSRVEGAVARTEPVRGNTKLAPAAQRALEVALQHRVSRMAGSSKLPVLKNVQVMNPLADRFSAPPLLQRLKRSWSR